MRLLVALAARAGLSQRREAMFGGDHLNSTEDRAVLHVALRMPPQAALVVDRQDVVGDVHAVLTQMRELAERIRSGAWTGYTAIRWIKHDHLLRADDHPANRVTASNSIFTP
jgi:glucose-6-phosphate isomerase